MYPYFYPSYFTPLKTGTGPSPAAPVKPKMPQEPSAAPVQPFESELPPVPGKTSGPPVEPTPPLPPMVQPPPVDFTQEPGPPVTTDIGYTQGYLKTQIGKSVKIEFLVGTNSTTDRIGTLIDVGISYVLLRLAESDDILMGDLYAIKFVTIYE